MRTTTTQGKLIDCSTDLLAVPVFAKSRFGAEASALNAALNSQLKAASADEGFSGNIGETIVLHTHGMIKPKRVVVVGMGDATDINAESIRRAAGKAAQVARTVCAKTVTLAFGSAVQAIDSQQSVQAATEGFWLAQYSYTTYMSRDKQTKAKQQTATQLQLHASSATAARQMRQGVTTGMACVAATNYTRNLVNAPAGHMKPKDLASAARALGKLPGIRVRIYTESEIKKMKMGSFLAVAAGSDEAPYFIHLQYTPRGAKKTVVLAGKGITFDSGGLSLKPTPHIENMKLDMAGAASVLGVFSQLTQLKPNVAVHGVIPTTENMPSGKATRPGDIATAYNGTTIEIANTDAEGRLILADALAWAEKTIKPDVMIDIATLTGAAMVALGLDVAPYFGTDLKLMEALDAAAERSGEQIWELPLVADYKPQLKSSIADLTNLTKLPFAGAITAALFLETFVDHTPWAHIDIAGPAWVEGQPVSYNQPGASGFSVRTLIEYIRALSKN